MDIALRYFVSGKGPVLEEDMPFVNTTEKISLNDIQGKEIVKKINEYVIFPSINKTKEDDTIIYENGSNEEYTQAEVESIRNLVKSHIMQYGGVSAYTSSSNEYFSNPQNWRASKAYNCDNPLVRPNHQITIIGWDDDYAVTNFNENHRPISKGAYIVQNSYGTERDGDAVLDNGYMYVSYEDLLVEQVMHGIKTIVDVDYDNLYQHDSLGNNLEIAVTSGSIAANVFDRNNEESEYLNEISIPIIENKSNLSYEIYVNAIDDEMIESKLKKIKTVNNSTQVGYITIKFDEPIELTGEKFVVAVKYVSTDSKIRIPIEARHALLPTWDMATSNKKESYISIPDSGSFIDINEEGISGTQSPNFCIKAFTTDIEEEEEITSTKYTIGQDKIISKISPNTIGSAFKSHITAQGVISIYDLNGDEITGEKMVGTGMKMKVGQNEYTLIIVADLNGDGDATVTDLYKMKQHIVGIENLQSVYLKAGDINGQNGITVTDLYMMKEVIIGKRVL